MEALGIIYDISTNYGILKIVGSLTATSIYIYIYIYIILQGPRTSPRAGELLLPQCAKHTTRGFEGIRAISSPAWHRRQRQARARVRKKVKAYRAGLCAFPKRACYQLLYHLSQPCSRELMGDKWRSSEAGRWGYWPGAFSPRPPWHKDKRKDRQGKNTDAQGEESLFPAYDNKKGGTSKVKVQAGEDLVTVLSSTRSQDTIVRDLQKLLNTARKAENRVAKVQADRAEKVKQWKEWEQQLKRCYSSEKQRHSANLASLDKELAEAIEQQELARQEVRLMASGPSAEPMEIVHSDEVDAEFAALLEEDGFSQEEEGANEDVLRRALQASLVNPATPPVMKATPRTRLVQKPVPKQLPGTLSAASGSRLQPFPPPKPMQTGAYPAQDLNPMPSPPASADPYQGMLLQQMGQPAGILEVVTPVVKHKSKIRTPLKDVAKPVGPIERQVIVHSPNKLEEKRLAVMQQMATTAEKLDLGGVCYGILRRCQDGGHGQSAKRSSEIRSARRRSVGWKKFAARVWCRDGLRQRSKCWKTLLIASVAFCDGLPLSAAGCSFCTVYSHELLAHEFARVSASSIFSFVGPPFAVQGGVVSKAVVCLLHCAATSLTGSVMPFLGHSVSLLLHPRTCQDPLPSFRGSMSSFSVARGCSSPGSRLSGAIGSLGSSLGAGFLAEPIPFVCFRTTSRDAVLQLCSMHSRSTLCDCDYKSFCKSFCKQDAGSIRTGISFSPRHVHPHNRERVESYSHGFGEGLNFWEWLQTQLEDFVRSMLLFIFVATLHLAVHVCPIRKGHSQRNRVKRAIRPWFRGASVLWAVAVVAHLLPVSCAMPANGNPEHTPADLPITNPEFSQGLPAPESSHEGRSHPGYAPSTARPPDNVTQESFANRLGLVDDFQFAIVVYAFQAPPILTSLWVSEASCEDDLRINLLLDAVSEPAHKVVIPVSPQPRTEAVAVIVAEEWNLEQLLVPVLLQVYSRGHSTFVEYFTGRATHADIRLSAGDLWHAGAQIFVGDATSPIAEDDLINPFPGLLFRVVPPFIVPGLTRTLSERLYEPEIWLCDIGRLRSTRFESGAGKICVLGQRADQMILSVDSSTTADALRQSIMEECGLTSNSTSFCSPSRQTWIFATCKSGCGSHSRGPASMQRDICGRPEFGMQSAICLAAAPTYSVV